jgi:hypothetical protein
MHLNETELNDYADGIATAIATAHLAECVACARELEQIRAIKAQLAVLPASIEPERDLRRGIWQAVDSQSRSQSPPWYRLAAAAVILVALTSVVTVGVMRKVERERLVAGAANDNPATLVTNDVRSLERQYSDELRELESVLQKSRNSLEPRTVRILEENLKIIDNAINEARKALDSDPNSDTLVDLLRSAYQRKLELLRQAAKSSVMT